MARSTTKRTDSKVDVRLEAVCSAGLLVADRDGLSRLTIRRVADEAGVPPMTTYGAISSKEELIGLIAERALAELTLPEPHQHAWQDNLVEIMAELRGLMLRHPSLPQVFATRRVSLSAIGLAKLIDAVLVELDRGGITGPDAVTKFFNLFTFALGYVLFELPRLADSELGEAVEPAAGRPAIAPYKEVVRIADEHALTQLKNNANEITRLKRADSYESGIRALLAG